jgi:hypothetical protein
MNKPLKKSAGKIPEYVIYAFLWLFFLIIPIITNNYGTRTELSRIKYDWLRMSPFLIVFLINSIILLPRILFRGYTKIYLSVLVVVILLITMVFQEIGPELYRNDPKLLEQRIMQDPQFNREDMQPGGMPKPGESAGREIFATPQGRGRSITNIPPLIQFLNTFLICLLIAGFNTAIAVTNKWVLEEQARKEVEKEHIQSELAFLQNQVSPHFFMNTLNNIHALVEADKNLAQDAILKLSELMRYLLYESGRGTTSLRKEIEFLKSYVNLMQLKVDDSVKVTFETPSTFNNVDLPPLLFISFIENAFKHGVTYREPSFLFFKLSQTGDQIEFESVNSIPAFKKNGLHQHGGIGLENIKKRLDLLYGQRYNLEIGKKENEFRVRLIIPF